MTDLALTTPPPLEPDGDLGDGPFRTADAEPMAIEDIRDALVIRENGIFLLTDKSGNVPLANESGFGMYSRDTRHLSGYQLSFGATRLVMLLSTAGGGYASEQVLTNPRMTDAMGRDLAREMVEIRRERHIDGALHERLFVTNFDVDAVVIDLTLRLSADFGDIFEIRGASRSVRGTAEPAAVGDQTLTFAYTATDGYRLRTEVRFDRRPDRLAAGRAVFRLRLQAGEEQAIGVTITPEARPAGTLEPGAALPQSELTFASTPVTIDPTAGRRRKAVDFQQWKQDCTGFLTGNEIFNAILDQSLTDLRTLWNSDGNGNGYLAAGTPWFDTIFGRDSLITSLQTLAFRPEIARKSLSTLAGLQGARFDEWRDEEPGKIIHEARTGEMARTNQVPFGRYYGSIDSTPLLLVLAHEYWRWTGDDPFIRSLWPTLCACAEWIERYGDRDGDGFVEYRRDSDNGLLNQGWKDSWNAIVDGDGRLAPPPIALVEVQAYVYAGLQGFASLAIHFGEIDRAAGLRQRADLLRRRFNRDFWDRDQEYYSLALDGSKRRVDSITSNPGHALFTGILSRTRAGIVGRRLLQPDMLSGWGIRTLSAASPRFNPMGYHVGTVWPHDNSIIALGLKRTGQEGLLAVLTQNLYDTAREMEYYRLPELFCGSARTPGSHPVPYPVACRPQSWAAGTIPLVLSALLGLCPNAPAGQLHIVTPTLPPWLDSVQVRNLRIGAATVDLDFWLERRKTRVRVVRNPARLDVNVVNRWPDRV